MFKRFIEWTCLRLANLERSGDRIVIEVKDGQGTGRGLNKELGGLTLSRQKIATIDIDSASLRTVNLLATVAPTFLVRTAMGDPELLAILITPFMPSRPLG